MWLYRVITLLLLQILSVQCFFNHYPKLNLDVTDDGDPGEPLFLTPYVESGNVTEGRRLARVPFTESLRIKSYAGYFTVDKKYDSNQFFWYFPAMISKKKDAPVIVWLQGGPGASSLYGLFTENGPLRVRKSRFERRKYNWALSHHIIYIDNPVGTGFSFTKDPKGYCVDQTQVGEQLYSTLVQFFQLFPELQGNKFFITGESYAGKYVPALAYTIYKKNPSAKIKINLKALAIGNGLSDPEHQLVYSKYLYQIGLIDWNQAKVFADAESEAIQLIKEQQWDKAFEAFDTLLNGDLINGKSVFYNMTGFEFYFNYLHTKEYMKFEDFGPMIQTSMVRKAIHVGNLTFNVGKEVENHLKQDVMKSVAPWISELLDHYYVLIYNGQLDIIVAYPLTLNYLRNLNFTGSSDYLSSKRYQWHVDGELAGYVKQGGKLVEIMVRNAGHMVPGDQPKWALDMITRLTHEKTFTHKKRHRV
ncbi:venom serine carboxypeptidase [Maniola hyperantus]|uniref:venom serine carboxypeptidase n=1 Tax=Aphantopus hyperantus TaxID=2795564 RepID=UPI00156A53D0|nr:venom serine carboxypeptidase [Maniola hyperantus]